MLQILHLMYIIARCSSLNRTTFSLLFSVPTTLFYPFIQNFVWRYPPEMRCILPNCPEDHKQSRFRQDQNQASHSRRASPTCIELSRSSLERRCDVAIFASSDRKRDSPRARPDVSCANEMHIGFSSLQLPRDSEWRADS
jgi:hypothetical protein